MTAARTIDITRLRPVAPGTAEALARVARFRELETVQPEELTSVARWITDLPVDAADRLLAELTDELAQLWHLVTDDWGETDLDDLTEDQWARVSFPTWAAEELHRYDLTRTRLVHEIEAAIWRARLATRGVAA